MRAYARQANRQLETDAAEIRIRAERRLGEMVAASPRTLAAIGQVQRTTIVVSDVDLSLVVRSGNIGKLYSSGRIAVIGPGAASYHPRYLLRQADFEGES
jgi:hypothetical protein